MADVSAREPAAVHQASQESPSSSARAGRRAFSFTSAVFAAGCAALAFLTLSAGGCAEGKLAEIRDAADFDRQVLSSPKPVAVEFYKEACPTCLVQEACMKQLADEYRGRVVFAKFKIRESSMTPAAPAIMDRYNLFWVPTVILFVDGKERERWLFNHTADEFRGELDKAVAAAGHATPAGPESSLGAKSPGAVPHGIERIP